MRMLRAFNALSYQNSTNETCKENLQVRTKARNYRILYVMHFYFYLINLKINKLCLKN